MHTCAPCCACAWLMCPRSLDGEGLGCSRRKFGFYWGFFKRRAGSSHSAALQHGRSHLPGPWTSGKHELWSMTFTEELCLAYRILRWAWGELLAVLCKLKTGSHTQWARLRLLLLLVTGTIEGNWRGSNEALAECRLHKQFVLAVFHTGICSSQLIPNI